MSASLLRSIPQSWPKPVLTSFVANGFVAPTAASGDKLYTLVRSATNEPIGQYEVATPTVVKQAVDAAQKAQVAWARRSPIERGRVLLEASRLLRQRTNQLAELETLNTSRPIAETLVVDIQSAADCFEYFGGSVSAQQVGETHDFPNGAFVYTRREPLGVTAGIGAFNYPIQSAAWKAAPALAFGNAMVFKPAEDTPWTALALAEILKEAGLPEGLFSVVLGAGQVGAMLTSDPRIAKISFTGSAATGAKIASSSGNELRKVTLELGGKSPLIIFDDCDLDKAVSGALLSNFYSNGEVCSNGTRVFVHEKIHDQFLQKLVSRVSKLRIGDPMDPETDIGALITEKHLQKVLGFVERGKADGAKLVYGGERLTTPKQFHKMTTSQLLKGAYMTPAVFSHVKDDSELAKTEVFGPVAAVLSFKTEDEVIERANDTVFGLAAGVFTNDLSRAHRVIHSLHAGQCWINHFNLAPVEIPWGGYKKSGMGRENGTEAIHYWTQIKTVHVESTKSGIVDPYPHAH